MPINRIVIVGGGLAAWLSASALCKAFGDAIGITVVESSHGDVAGIDNSLGVPLVACTSGPLVTQFNHAFGYNEDALIAATRGGYTLGNAISNWCSSATVFNPFGEVGAALGPVNFQQVALRLRAINKPISLANYSLAALCAQAGRFAKPTTAGSTPLSQLEYGLQIDIVAYAQALKADAISSGVSVTPAKYKQCLMNDAGLIGSVITADGNMISGDLFIDCSGAARILVNSITQRHIWVDWSSWLPCSFVSNVVAATGETPQPFTHLQAGTVGWRSNISLQGKQCVVVSSVQEDGGLKFYPGTLAAPWNGNCVALGGASLVVDPACSLAFDLLCSGVRRLIGLIPDSNHCEQEMIEFNRQSRAGAECARDYAIAHYKLNNRVGDVFWDGCRNMQVPESLEHRIEVYKNCGRVVMLDGEMVDRFNWATLFDASGLRPEQYDVLTRSLPVQLVNEHLAAIREALLGTVASLPSYQSYLSHKQ